MQPIQCKVSQRIFPIVLGMMVLSVWTAESATSKSAAAKAPAAIQAVWHDVTTWGVEGRAWADQPRQRYFDRFPAKADGKVPASVWNLSRDSAGMMARFKTDADAIHVRYKLLKDKLAQPHMPATGVSGFDLYARDGAGQWRWVNVNKPEKAEAEMTVISGMDRALREYAMYLPLYNGVESLEIGVPKQASFEPLAPRSEKPMVFYGTSITHGACASRPGMVHTAILGRRFNRPVVNLGFSGNGKMDASVGELLCELPAAVFIIDCLPNMSPALVKERTAALVKQLRAAHPGTPIILVEDREMTNTWIRPERQKFHRENHEALKAEFEALKASGVTGIYYLAGSQLLGDDTEGATDGSHPSDLGFMRQADAFTPVLREALTGTPKP